MFRFFSLYCMSFQFLLVYQKQRDHAPPSTYKTPKKCHAQYLSTSQINDEISRSHTYNLTQANELDQLAQGMKHNNNVLTQHWAETRAQPASTAYLRGRCESLLSIRIILSFSLNLHLPE